MEVIMKTLIKRIGALLFTILMINTLFMSTAFAGTPSIDPNITKGSLTISKAGSSFTIYKIYSMTCPANSGAYKYDITGTEIDGYLSSNGITAEDVSKYTAEETAAFIAGIQAFIKTNSITGVTVTADAVSGKAAFSDLDLGYYLVVETGTDNTKSTVASKSFLVSVPSLVTSGATDSWNYNVAAEPKDSQAAIKKVIVKGGEVTSATHNIGDIVNYKLESDVPTYDASAADIKYFITDTMDKGLTFKSDSLVITGDSTPLTAVTDYEVTVDKDVNTGVTAIKIDFSYDNIKNFTKITVNYQAELNEKANIGNIGNQNNAALSYTSNPLTGTIYEDINHKTIVYTTGIAINKKDDVTHEDLAGAVFELCDSSKNVLAVYTYDAAGTARVLSTTSGISAETNASGMKYFIGLDEGTYYINEKTAPAGYSLISESVKVMITASKDASGQYNGQFTYQYAFESETPTQVYNTNNETDIKKVGSDIFIQVNITDHAGFTLPGTGGIGTTIFMISGIAIMMLGAVMLVIYKVKHKKNFK
jgi:fimbrial isopeptide formation D2 family protein/LPXTG-motif cell wall-anchored protein